MRQADQERDEAKARLREQEQFADDAYPILTQDQLRGRRIGLVVLGNDDGAPDMIRRALQPTGADLALVAIVRENVELDALAERAARHALRGRRRATRRCSTTSAGGPASRWCSAAGSSAAAHAAAAVAQRRVRRPGRRHRHAPVREAEGQGDRRAAAPSCRTASPAASSQTGVKVVGVERRASDPSHIGWYRDRELSSVDNVDEQAGRAAMVFVLAGAQGAYGRRDGAQALLPPVVGQVR